MNKPGAPKWFPVGKRRFGWRQWATALAVLGLASGCGGAQRTPGIEGFVEGFYGGIAADEPRAVTVGRSVLSAGGTAGDAAVAIYFSLAVTMPSRASLGGGGICIVHDPKAMKTEALEFLPRAPAAPASPGGVAIAVPGTVRGMYAVYARIGRLRWEGLVEPGERFARFGFDVTRAFARDLAAAGPSLAREPSFQGIFLGPSGAPLTEGQRMRQLDLAAVLTRIRTDGPAAFYTGAIARDYVEGARAIGASIAIEDLRDYKPVWRSTIRGGLGSHVAHFAGGPALGGLLSAELWAALEDGGRYDDAREDERPHLIAEASALFANAPPVALDAKGRVRSEWINGLMRGYGAAQHRPASQRTGERGAAEHSTGFAVVDREGAAVACALTAGPLFGANRLVPGTGIVAADPATDGSSLAPMIAVNENAKDTILAVAAAGDASASQVLNAVMLAVVEDRKRLADAVAAPRLRYDAAIDSTVVEVAGDAVARSLAARGHNVGRVSALARVNAIYCSDGVQRDPATCQTVTDPRGLGLAVGGGD